MDTLTGSSIRKANLPPELVAVLDACPRYRVAESIEQLVELALEGAEGGWKEVAFDVPGKGRIVEARVCRVRNGVAANYLEAYMRRRDPDCMVIADSEPTDKTQYRTRFGRPFAGAREETFEWLKGQDLALLPFVAGAPGKGQPALAVCPAAAGFFALGLAMLQGILQPDAIGPDYVPGAIIYVAPPLRHTHFGGKQVVVHNRLPGMHEIFSYNLYPGPSAKKGVYGMLLAQGEAESWITAHASTVQIRTPYDNKLVLMHEGASGGGKSEMLERVHREADGRLLLGENLKNGDRVYLTLPRECELRPVTDDMALCHPADQRGDGRLWAMDAEDAWFLRVNHIDHYGIDGTLEEMTIHPPLPQLFLNIDAVPGSTALIWEHVEDSPGVRCPNPRVVVPRAGVPNVVDGAVSVQVRSFGVRCPPCTRRAPSYGILGLFHILPPALAWLWRLVAPRGHGNPSIIGGNAMTSEGVGSYWPFATGRRVRHANLLLRQIVDTPRVHYKLCPNQHVGAWKVGFMPQWLMRDYIARRGSARYTADQVMPARCPLLGYALRHMLFEGQEIDPRFLRVELQTDVGTDAYDAGAGLLTEFFHAQLRQYLDPELDDVGRRIIEACLRNASVEEYNELLPADTVVDDE